jgi:hypothetical protein
MASYRIPEKVTLILVMPFKPVGPNSCENAVFQNRLFRLSPQNAAPPISSPKFFGSRRHRATRGPFRSSLRAVSDSGERRAKTHFEGQSLSKQTDSRVQTGRLRISPPGSQNVSTRKAQVCTMSSLPATLGLEQSGEMVFEDR